MTASEDFDFGEELAKIRVPHKSDKVYKDECVFSFDTPDSETGLYVCLRTFLGLGRDFVEGHFKRTGSRVYLHIKRDRIEIADKQGDGPERKVTKLAIGIDGGFDANSKNFETTETYSVVILPGFTTIAWPSDRLPLIVSSSIQGILESESAAKMAEIEALTGTWDGEVRMVSKHAATLMQLDNGVKVPPSGWKCEKCDLTTNLWLNLTDGMILCGRKYFDGTGGNEHALEHYRNTGYPLAVKLGTITKDGKGDVYSYDEDDMVDDPHLVQHLANFGINIQNLEKTEKSMAELELDLNQKYGEWSALQEASGQLKPAYGPGFTGLNNMGNSCYLNAVVQVLFAVPDFVQKYYKRAAEYFSNPPSDPSLDFNIQMAKLASGLLSGKYSHPPPEGPRKKIVPPPSPHMFKYLIGKGHPAFSTKNQQDAQEFFLHLLSVVQRNCRGSDDPTECFKFQVEDKFQCGTSGKVKYMNRTEYCLPLTIPLSAVTNQEEVAAYEERKASGQKMDPNEIVRRRLKLTSCLEAFSQSEVVEQFYSSAIQDKTTAIKRTRLSTFPDFLVLNLKKFMLKEDWTPIKLDVAVEMPDVLDLSELRGRGVEPGEELLPEISQPPPTPHYNEAMVAELASLNFPMEAIKRALFYTQNKGVQEATNWLLNHIGDEDLHTPFVPPGTQPSPQVFVPNEEALATLMDMGFTVAQATKALKATDNNLERAGDWIFSHANELDAEEEPAPSSSQPPAVHFRDGSSKYKLVGFISHMGTSISVGHYVCHVLKNDQWIIFNDEKVAFSENPPKELGYLYFYQRV